MKLRDQVKMLRNEEVRIAGNLMIIVKDTNTFIVPLCDSTYPVI